MPLQVESDSCDRSGVEYVLAKKHLEKLRVVVFHSEGKILLTLFGDQIIHRVTENKFQSQDGAGLNKKLISDPRCTPPRTEGREALRHHSDNT